MRLYAHNIGSWRACSITPPAWFISVNYSFDWIWQLFQLFMCMAKLPSVVFSRRANVFFFLLLFRFLFLLCAQDPMAVRGEEVARRTRATRRWNWRKSSTLTTTWRGGGGSKSPTPCAWRSAKSRFGSRTGAWNWRRSWGPSRKSTSKRVASARSKRARSATAAAITTATARASTSTTTLRRRITSNSNNINSTDSKTGAITFIITICCRPPLRPTTPPTSAKWPPRA